MELIRMSSNEYMRTYMFEYRKLEKGKEIQKKYYQKNKEKIKLNSREWDRRNPKERSKRVMKCQRKYPIKTKARRYALRHKQINGLCKPCLKEGKLNIKDLQFHHTNYERNEGFTVCLEHHNKIHT